MQRCFPPATYLICSIIWKIGFCFVGQLLPKSLPFVLSRSAPYVLCALMCCIHSIVFVLSGTVTPYAPLCQSVSPATRWSFTCRQRKLGTSVVKKKTWHMKKIHFYIKRNTSQKKLRFCQNQVKNKHTCLFTFSNKQKKPVKCFHLSCVSSQFLSIAVYMSSCCKCLRNTRKNFLPKSGSLTEVVQNENEKR